MGVRHAVVAHRAGGRRMAHGIATPHGIVAHRTGGRRMAHGSAIPHGIVAHAGTGRHCRMVHVVIRHARALGECRDREGRGKQSGGSESRNALEHNWLLRCFQTRD